MAVRIASINEVRLVGMALGKPEFPRSPSGKTFAKFDVETERYDIVNGERRRTSQVHKIVCYNALSVSFLQRHLQEGMYVRVAGELVYDRNSARIQVNDHMGEAAIMYIPEAEDEKTPASRSSAGASGGVGKIKMPKSSEYAPANERPVDDTPTIKPGKSRPAQDFDDSEIPF